MGRPPTLAKGRDPAARPVDHAAEMNDTPDPSVISIDATRADFDDLYRREFSRVVSVVHSLVGRRDIAEEITQEAFVVTHDRWRRISAYAHPADFVRRVAINRAMSSLRRRAAERRAIERFTGRASRPTDDGMLDHPLWVEVRRLPSRQAQAIALTYVDDLPIERVADVLGCSVNTVKTHLKRGRATLAATVGLDLDDTDDKDDKGTNR